MGSGSARTRSQKKHEGADEDVSMDEELLGKSRGKLSKQQAASSSKLKSAPGPKKRAISNADESGAPSKKVRPGELKVPAKATEASGKALKSNNMKSSSGGRGLTDESPHRPAPSKDRKFRAPEEIDVKKNLDPEPRDKRSRPQSKAKPNEEIDVEESDDDDVGPGNRSDKGEISLEEDEDDGKRNNYEIPVWHGKQSSHQDRKEPLSDAHDPGPASGLFNNEKKCWDCRSEAHKEIKVKAEQPGWGDDEPLSDLDLAPRSRNHTGKKPKHSHKRRVPTPEPNSGDSDSNLDTNVWEIVHKDGRVPILQQSPLLRSIIQTASSAIHRYAITENFYPLSLELEKQCRKELYNAALSSEVDGSDKVARLIKKDEKYANDLIAVVRGKFGTLRCDVRDYASNCVPGHYRLGPECADDVKWLRDDDVFIYVASHNEVGYDESKAYQHDAIIAIIRWFFQDCNAVGTAVLPEFCLSIRKKVLPWDALADSQGTCNLWCCSGMPWDALGCPEMLWDVLGIGQNRKAPWDTLCQEYYRDLKRHILTLYLVLYAVGKPLKSAFQRIRPQII
ncbi:hypothetical protein FA13DRAFT_1713534 [Coprinellus micaceus]|uniref:DUF6532 domain-containing protein n=1 Tax=Coprinellus micaceus TaxID=71717 RepID=A0A4Y7SWB2_COPMI|nr:hypothetical protein FA13DRAFT_1713534 [Coprinellus micaceus]